jgi:hypothetical protein
MEIIVYGNLDMCGKCRILHKKLEDKNIEFEFVENMDKIVDVANEIGTNSLPISIVDGEYKTFSDMIKIVSGL